MNVVFALKPSILVAHNLVMVTLPDILSTELSNLCGAQLQAVSVRSTLLAPGTFDFGDCFIVNIQNVSQTYSYIMIDMNLIL